MNPTAAVENWSLEIVRGKDVGHRFALKAGSLVLGNALNGSAGIDLGRRRAMRRGKWPRGSRNWKSPAGGS